MITETRQISNLRSQDFSKGILSDLVGENVAEFSDKFFHFHYATREMCQEVLNNYSMLNDGFFNQHPHFCNLLELPQIGVDQCLSFLPQLLLLRSLFSFER